MTKAALEILLLTRPDRRICPNCGGAGERVFPRGGKVIECTTCKGEGHVAAETPGGKP